MATNRGRQQQRSPSISNRKRLKAEEQARQQAEARTRLARRLLPVLLIVVIVIVVGSWRLLRQGAGSDALILDDANGTGAGIAWSPDGQSLALNGDSQGDDAQIFATTNGSLSRRLYGSGGSGGDLAWSPSGAYLAAATQPSAAKGKARPALLDLWQTAGWSHRALIVTQGSLTGSVAKRVAFSPDSKRLAVQTDHRLAVFSVPELRQLVVTANQLATSGLHPILAWSRDGTRIAVGLTGQNLQNTVGIGIFDATTLQEKLVIALTDKFPANLVAAAAWSPDGRSLAVAGQNGVVALFNSTIGRRTKTFTEALPSISAMDWSSNGAWIVAGGNSAVAIWDKAGALLYRLAEPVDLRGSGANQNTVAGVAWAPDSTRLAISGNNARPRIWKEPANTGGS